MQYSKRFKYLLLKIKTKKFNLKFKINFEILSEIIKFMLKLKT